jgi:predicted RND superfamily exporter protein
MVASIMIGLVVDNTIHFLARFRIEEQRALAQGHSDPLRHALHVAGTGTGRAMLVTSLILAVGFFTQLFSGFEPNRNFGLLCGACVLLACAGDMIVLPAVIRAIPLLRRRPQPTIQPAAAAAASSGVSASALDIPPPQGGTEAA